MSHRPKLRRVYLALQDLAPYADAAARLGFQTEPALDRTVDGKSYSTAWLDFGPGSVDGWLAALVAAELGIEDSTELVDTSSREALVGDGRVQLSAREFDVLSLLHHRRGQPVSRQEILLQVWQDEDVMSNVVDAVVYGLRRKLGAEGERLETIRGIGYRLRPP